MSGRMLLMVNPVAGGGRALRAAERARTILAASRPVTMEPTRGAGHAAELAARARQAGDGCVVVCGGDGTINEAAGALAGSAVALGILPFGRGNDLARALRIPRRLDQAIGVIANGVTRRIDLGRVNGRVFCTVAAAGFDAEVAHRVRTGIWHHAGRFGYAWGVVRSLAALQAREVRLEGDFGTRSGRYLLAAVSNTGSSVNLSAASREQLEKLRAQRMWLPPSRVTVGKIVGLHASWFVYRGAGRVTFDPPQIASWEDTRTGGNSPWAPLWTPPELAEDGKVSVRATFDEPGEYVIRVRADDGALTSDGMVTITVTK